MGLSVCVRGLMNPFCAVLAYFLDFCLLLQVHSPEFCYKVFPC